MVAWWKLLLLIKTFPLSGSHSFQCFKILTSRSYQKLSEYLNINDSVRSLQTENLLYIHIPREVFQSTEGYLEPSQASGVESFFKKTLTASFFKKTPSQTCHWALNTPFGLFFYIVYVLLEFQHDHLNFLQNECFFQ